MVTSSLYSDKYRYVIFYCAKSGCSTVRNMFLYLHNEELQKTPDNYHQLDSFFPLTADIHSVNKFTVVRNPYRRALSMFVNKFIGNNMMKDKFKNNNIEIKNNSFIAFLNGLKCAKNKNILNGIDLHYCEQVYQMLDNLHFVKLENFKSEIKDTYLKIIKINQDDFFKRLDTLLENDGIMNQNKTSYINNSYENATYKEFNHILNIPSFEAFYNKEAQDLVFEIYKNDFLRFGYTYELE